MTHSVSVFDRETFLADQKNKLSEVEHRKLNEFFKEAAYKRQSFLGEIFVVFKRILRVGAIADQQETAAVGVEAKKNALRHEAFRSDYESLDLLSNYYGNKYRGSYVYNYLMGAIAVFVALTPIGFSFEHIFKEDAHRYELICSGIELAIIVSILAIYKVGGIAHGKNARNSILGLRINRRWHEKWLEYRTLSERFRYMELLYPIGIEPPQKASVSIWGDAYFAWRLSQVNTKITHNIEAYKDRLLAVMEEQREYHFKNALWSERIQHRLHTIATWMFYFTLIACASHFVLLTPIIILASGFFPAFAAAIHGISSSGEFGKSAQVSAQMKGQIDSLIDELNKTRDIEIVRMLVKKFHKIVVGESEDWKVIFKDKNVPLA